VLFAAVVGSLLIVRRRVHVDRQRRIALGLAGVTALAAAGLVASFRTFGRKLAE